MGRAPGPTEKRGLTLMGKTIRYDTKKRRKEAPPEEDPPPSSMTSAEDDAARRQRGGGEDEAPTTVPSGFLSLPRTRKEQNMK